MRKKIFRLISVIMIVGILCGMNITAVLAEDISDNVLETDLDFSEDTTYSVLRGTNLNYGTTKIAKLASIKLLLEELRSAIIIVLKSI